jgi:hypothetical protein
MNHYKAKDCALVRNVWLPAAYGHTTTPDTAHLLKSQQIRDWINDYRPADKSIVKLRCDEQFDADASGILWAADVWYSLKKHWVIELQRWIRAKRGVSHETARGLTASMLADQQVQIGSRKSEIGNRKSPKFMLPLRMHKQVEATDEPADGPPHSGPAPQGGKEREHSFLDEQVPLCPCVYDC